METFSLPNLSRLPSSALTARLYSLRAEERTLLVEFLRYLGELDRRKLYLELGFSSLFAYCTDFLGLSRSSTFRRTTATRLLLRFPILADYLADGRLGLTTLVELREVLCPERLGEILDRAAGRTEDEVKVLVAALQPRPAPPDLLRRLPERHTVEPVVVSAGAALTDPVAEPIRAPEVPPRPPLKAPRIEPISEERHVLRMTVGREFVADLDKVRAALSHQIADRSLEKVIHECIRRTLRECARRQTGAVGRRKSPAEPVIADAGAKPSRHIPAAVRDAVWRRDEGRCAFIGVDGHRCDATFQVQFHHVQPFAKGGRSTVSNDALRCSGHNAYHAEKDYGAEHMARAVTRNRTQPDAKSETLPLAGIL